jgi:uncharacterized glyoxalase superfamily protein PhnB
MPKASHHIPSGFTTLTVHLTVPGCAGYIDFLRRAFNAVEISRSPGPGGKLMHANVKIGGTIMMLNDTFPEMGGPPIAEGNWPLRLNLYVPDADATWAQALANGCQVVFPLQDQFWGESGHTTSSTTAKTGRAVRRSARESAPLQPPRTATMRKAGG